MYRSASWLGLVGLVALSACTTPAPDPFAGARSVGSRPYILRAPTRPSAPEARSAPSTPAEPAATAPAPSETPAVSTDPARTNDAGIALIKAEEGLRLTAYQEPSGLWLIGYGHSATARPGMTVTEAEAEALLRQDLRAIEEALAAMITVPVNTNEFSALVSLAYTIGIGRIKSSTVLARLNSGDRSGAADAILMWTKVRRDGVMVDSPVLIARRQKERALFLMPVGTTGS